MLSFALFFNTTGTLTPDATCNYAYAGMHDGKPYYRRIDGSYYLWFDGGSNYWFLTSHVPGPPTGAWWVSDTYGLATPADTYSPAGTATGTATVAVGQH